MVSPIIRVSQVAIMRKLGDSVDHGGVSSGPCEEELTDHVIARAVRRECKLIKDTGMISSSTK